MGLDSFLLLVVVVGVTSVSIGYIGGTLLGLYVNGRGRGHDHS